MAGLPEKLNPAAHFELIAAAREQESIVANLLELYAHDFSEFHHLELGANGRFGYNQLPLYWSEPGRHPFLVEVDGKLAGLVLVKRVESVWDMAEFFILRAYRRRGIGIAVAHKVWSRFPGPWAVRVMQSNRTALDFWQRAIAAFNGKPIHPVRVETDGQGWYVFAFDSRHNS